MNEQQQQELIRLVGAFSPRDGIHPTLIPGLKCIKGSALSMKFPVVYEPSFCLIVQGEKEVMLEEERYRYAPSQFLMVSVDLPVTGQVVLANRDVPYLSIQIDLDLRQINELIPEIESCDTRSLPSSRGLFVGEADVALVGVVLRLVELLESPGDIDFLAPLIKRELYYRLLKGPYGSRVVQMAVQGGNMQRISQVIRFLKSNFDQPVCITQMVDMANMSPSSFHAHFKEVTAMSPLQYQKRLRLLEARRIMLVDAVDASKAAYRVGYESPSQFSREYSRMFGAPPLRDIESLRAQAV